MDFNSENQGKSGTWKEIDQTWFLNKPISMWFSAYELLHQGNGWLIWENGLLVHRNRLQIRGNELLIRQNGLRNIQVRVVVRLPGLKPPHFSFGSNPEPELRYLTWSFCIRWFEMIYRCFFYWYWWNFKPLLLKIICPFTAKYSPTQWKKMKIKNK